MTTLSVLISVWAFTLCRLRNFFVLLFLFLRRVIGRSLNLCLLLFLLRLHLCFFIFLFLACFGSSFRTVFHGLANAFDFGSVFLFALDTGRLIDCFFQSRLKFFLILLFLLRSFLRCVIECFFRG